MKYSLIVIFIFSVVLEVTAQPENQPPMNDWQYPYDVHKITLSDSLDVAYIDEGEGECTLVFVHGLGSNLKAWYKSIELMKSNCRCIALDLPGYGKSSKGNYPFQMTFFAGAVLDFLQRMDLNQIVLVGHSMGGQVAMHAVLQDDANIDKLILMAPAGFEVFTEAEKAWFQSIYTPAVVKAATETEIEKNFHLNFHVFPEDARFMIDDRLLLLQSAEYDHYCNMIPKCVMGMLNQPVYDHLSEIRMPTLIIFGENDALIPNRLLHPTLTTAGVAQSGHERFAQSEVKMIASAGHFVQWEQAMQVHEAIWQFLGHR